MSKTGIYGQQLWFLGRKLAICDQTDRLLNNAYLLDNLATSALKLGGQVATVPAERMPTKTGIAAI